MYYQLLETISNEKRALDHPKAANIPLCQRLVEDMRLVEKHQLQEQEMSVEFLADPASLYLDYLRTEGIYGSKLCSLRFWEILKQEAVPCVAYPAQLLAHHSQQVITQPFFFLIFPFLTNAIDWERSESLVLHEEIGERHLSKIVFTEACEVSAPLLFCTRGRYFIHERLCTQLEKADIQGAAFAPLDAALSPSASLEMLDLQRNLQVHADDWSSWLKLSDCLRRLGRYEEALEPLNQALRVRPDGAEIWYQRSKILRRLGRFQEALEVMEQSIQSEHSILFWDEYCTVLQCLERWDLVAVEAEKGVKEWGGDSPIPWFHLGAAHEVLGNYETALFAVDRGLELGGGGYRYKLLQLKGQVLYELKRYTEALETYELGLARYKSLNYFWIGKMNTLKVLGRIEEAQKVEKLFEQDREARSKKRPS